MFSRDIALAVGGFRGASARTSTCGVGSSSGRGTLSPRVGMLYHTHPGQISGDWEAMHAAHLNVARSFAGEKWWSPGLVERRAGVRAWDRYRERRRTGAAARVASSCASRGTPAARARRGGGIAPPRGTSPSTSRLALSGEPSVAVLSGVDPATVPEQDRYEVDLSTTGSLRAITRLARRPSAAAMVSSRPQAALVRLAGTRPVRVGLSAAEPESELDGARPAEG